MSAAGRLRHRVAFEARVVADDGAGNRRGAFAQRFVVWAEIRAKLGGEAVTAARLTGQQPVTITVRRSPDTAQIGADWRAVDLGCGTIYAIRSIVDPDDRRAWLELLCETGVAA